MLQRVRNNLTFAVVLLEDFSTLSFGAIVEPLRLLSNDFPEIGTNLVLFGLDSHRVRSRGGVVVECDADCSSLSNRILEGNAPSAILFCGSTEKRLVNEKSIVLLMRLARRSGVAVYGLGSVAWLMAESGFLSGGECTTHWKTLAAFAEHHRDVKVKNALYVENGLTSTCAGELATLDLLISLISTISPEAACAVANYLLMPSARIGTHHQPGSQTHHLRHAPHTLRVAAHIMENNIEEPHTISQIVAQCDTSSRNLERLFKKYLNTSPMRYYNKLKLERAFELISQTNMSLSEITVAAGYPNFGTLAKNFKRLYGETPSDLRKRLISGGHA
ncbi:GlxA family transcriptional regulator [Defluviimonas sp. SAOS-178_SWC]|uniref:GlxA family transcriptional regulator n=1 Tax=Defluviimonas sp. SAOS-178_SWC TaxID=3121287 RepID=UPI003221AAF9